jgi:hypothetical protein
MERSAKPGGKVQSMLQKQKSEGRDNVKVPGVNDCMLAIGNPVVCGRSTSRQIPIAKAREKDATGLGLGRSSSLWPFML